MSSLARSTRVVVSLIAPLLISCPITAHAQPASDGALKAGYDAFYRGDRTAADARFREILQKQPGDLGATFGDLVVAHSRLGPDTPPSPSFEHDLDNFIATTSNRYDSNHSDDDALFNLAFAYTLRSIYKIDHDKGMVGAARDGAHARGYIDTYLQRHPDNGDAHLVRGLYNYFVDLAPSFLHIFRFFLFLPAGDRKGGLQDIEYAATHGVLFGRLAQIQLIPIYGALEGRPAEAVALGERLERELPSNDDVAFALADVYMSPGVEEWDKAGQVYTDVGARHRADGTDDGIAARARASYGLAAARFSAWRCQDAIGILTETIDAGGKAPAWVLPRFLLRRAGDRMLVNDRDAAADARRVLNDPVMSRWHDEANDAIKRISEYQTSGDSDLYAALIPANRLVAEGRYEDAQQAYATIAAGRLNDPQVKYRLAYLEFARRNNDEARSMFEGLTSARGAPDWVRAGSWLYLGRIADLAGQRETAVNDYHKVASDFSGERAAFAAQVGLITPYQRPPH